MFHFQGSKPVFERNFFLAKYILIPVNNVVTNLFVDIQLGEDELRDAKLLLFPNKQDLPNAMSATELTDN